MALKVDLSLFLFGAAAPGSRSFVEFVIVMNNHSVVSGRNTGVFDPCILEGR